jgi:hypothetical protein
VHRDDAEAGRRGVEAGAHPARRAAARSRPEHQAKLYAAPQQLEHLFAAGRWPDRHEDIDELRVRRHAIRDLVDRPPQPLHVRSSYNKQCGERHRSHSSARVARRRAP